MFGMAKCMCVIQMALQLLVVIFEGIVATQWEVGVKILKHLCTCTLVTGTHSCFYTCNQIL